MTVVIDTSSLLSSVRYYLPFDSEDKLKQLFQTKVECGGRNCIGTASFFG
jgi:hypothetical protein